jgi:hypothetical protein
MHNQISKQLEEAFFTSQDQKLIENLRKMRQMKETKEALANVSGIRNDAVLDKLVSLNVRPETLASFCIVPLVNVAWADGHIDEKEKQTVLSAAEKMGYARGGVDYDLIKLWMTRKPSEDLLTAWTHYIEGLCENLTDEEKKLLKADIMGHAKAIAEASGGFLGMGIGDTISKSEKEMLSKLESAFK